MTRNRQTEGRALGFLKKTAEHVAKRYQKDFSSENNNWSDSKVAEAAKYALDAGGKRLRPALVIAAALAVGPGDQDEEQIFSSDVISVATAFEYIHTYSLIHDDLPVMDNDAMRRGQPSCHMAFGVETDVKAGV
ncbi:MAG: polyprenyl synthetase family protein, partial [Candidatus Lindowbacteria bacterium]|nr:polyprenyl synthetase family protein [Candidatus Lindowbacteria bacterium]